MRSAVGAGRSVGRSVGWLEDNYYPAGFSISNCRERILVAGLYTDLVRGTKTKKGNKRQEGMG